MAVFAMAFTFILLPFLIACTLEVENLCLVNKENSLRSSLIGLSPSKTRLDWKMSSSNPRSFFSLL